MIFNNLKEVCDYLNKGKDDDDDKINEETTFGEIVDEFKGIGQLDHVYAYCDDVHLLEDIDDSLSVQKINEIDEDNDDVTDFLEIASNMSRYSDIEITDDVLDDIREDKQSRGEEDDCFI